MPVLSGPPESSRRRSLPPCRSQPWSLLLRRSAAAIYRRDGKEDNQTLPGSKRVVLREGARPGREKTDARVCALETAKTACFLRDMAIEKETTSQFVRPDDAVHEIPTEEAGNVRDLYPSIWFRYRTTR